ncbi:right-handed parallel beta-helix repeat-containing protein [Candidatus Parcubacteria bacterium]|nr:right-handed parallel beta-helix repeat-containing protein [Candidatus Parcubacteria bacterium]
MKKQFIILSILVFAVLGCFVLVGQVNAETEVSGIIDSDTTWTLANSPYIVTGNILVNEGVVLIIEPGVFVKFKTYFIAGEGHYIKIDGTLMAIGTETEKITFTKTYFENNNRFNLSFNWGSIYFSDNSIDWSDKNKKGSIMENCIFEYGSNNNNINSNIASAVITIDNSSPLIKNNIFKNIDNRAISIGGGQAQIINNKIMAGSITIQDGLPLFSYNEITGCGFEINGGSPIITKNNIYNDDKRKDAQEGIRINSGCPVISNNNIFNNPGGGIVFVNFNFSTMDDYTCIYKIYNNNIYDNKFSVLLIDTLVDVDLSNNWWGSIDEDEIKNSIYDRNNNFTLGEVNYKPFLKQAETDVPIVVIKTENIEIENNNQTTENNNIDNNQNNSNSQSVIQEEKSLITKIDKNLSKRMSGKILLQVEKNGEGWYVSPDNQKKYYLGRPADAFSIMRNLGLGIKHSELNNYINSTFPSRLSGKIMLDVEQNGEAYYINPNNLKGYYLNRPSDAFRIMRELGLGITNSDVRKIDIGEVE